MSWKILAAMVALLALAGCSKKTTPAVVDLSERVDAEALWDNGPLDGGPAPATSKPWEPPSPYNNPLLH